MQPSALVRIGLETRSHHLDVDSAWLELLARNVTRTRYIARLVRVYGFEAPLEAAFAYTPGLAALIDLRDRTRAGWLAQDLIALGVPPVQVTRLPQCAEIEPFVEVTEALGWLYAVERSRLMHGHLCRHLHARFGSDLACSYLAASAEAAGARWIELGTVLDGVVDLSRVIVAAHDALACQVRWSNSDSVERRAI